MAMRQTERQKKLLTYLAERGFTSVRELSRFFAVSDMTIRRDLAELENRGFLARTYGGATLSESAFFEVSFKIKTTQFVEEKKRIGAAAAQLVNHGDTVLLDAGSTVAQVAQNLRDKRITVVTNALNIASEFMDCPQIEILICGGILRKGPVCLIGPQADEFFQNVRCDILILGVEGIDANGILSVPDLTEAHTKRAMVASARKIVVVADHSKLGRNTLGAIVPLSKANTLITGQESNPEILAELSKIIEISTV